MMSGEVGYWALGAFVVLLCAAMGVLHVLGRAKLTALSVELDREKERARLADVELRRLRSKHNDLEAALANRASYLTESKSANLEYLTRLISSMREQFDLVEDRDLDIQSSIGIAQEEMAATLLVDRRKRFETYLTDLRNGTESVVRMIAVLKDNLDIASDFQDRMRAGLLDFAVENANYKKVCDVLTRIRAEGIGTKIDAMRVTIRNEQIAKNQKLRDRLAETPEERELRRSIKTQAARSVIVKDGSNQC